MKNRIESTTVKIGATKVRAEWTQLMTFDLVATPGFRDIMMFVDPVENPIIVRRNRFIKSINNG